MEISNNQTITVQSMHNMYSQTSPENKRLEDSVQQTDKPSEQMDKFHQTIKEQGEEQAKKIQPDDTTKATMLSQAMTHNVVQNVSTQDILKLMGNK